MTNTKTGFDFALCGGGLQNSLIIAALCGMKSSNKIALIEKSKIGGNHTWCFFGSDISQSMRDQLAPYISYHWSCYEVRFPKYSRILHTPYYMMSSTKLREIILSEFKSKKGSYIYEDTTIKSINQSSVNIQNGTSVKATILVDSRGTTAHPQKTGFQKFYGQELSLKSPHNFQHPILMDATVPQKDGFRFMYVLPLSNKKIIIEDTSFSNGPELEENERIQAISDWLQKHKLEPTKIHRTEKGILPMPWCKHATPKNSESDKIIYAGYLGGWFHPGTGYSIPVAAELAEIIATTSHKFLFKALKSIKQRLQYQAKFFYLLNKFLFLSYTTENRINIFENFYKLPENTIRRFYSMSLVPKDKFKIFRWPPPKGLSLFRLINLFK